MSLILKTVLLEFAHSIQFQTYEYARTHARAPTFLM
jgi:hypothetical protein